MEKFLLEKYLDIVLMVFINIFVWVQHPELKYWNTAWNIVNSIFTIVWLIYIVFYPIYGFLVIFLNKDNLGSDSNLTNFGVLYEEQRYHKLHGALFNVRAMVRRLLVVVAFTCFVGHPYFQIISLTILSFLSLFEIAYDNVYHTKGRNIIEFWNEFLIYTAIWSTMNFQMFVPDSSKNIIGWWYIFSGVLLIVVSIIVAVIAGLS